MPIIQALLSICKYCEMLGSAAADHCRCCARGLHAQVLCNLQGQKALCSAAGSLQCRRERGLSDSGCCRCTCTLQPPNPRHLLCLPSPILFTRPLSLRLFLLSNPHPPTNKCHNHVCVLFDNCNFPRQLSIRVDSNFSLI